jgi:hypothetical protein
MREQFSLKADLKGHIRLLQNSDLIKMMRIILLIMPV